MDRWLALVFEYGLSIQDRKVKKTKIIKLFCFYTKYLFFQDDHRKKSLIDFCHRYYRSRKYITWHICSLPAQVRQDKDWWMSITCSTQAKLITEETRDNIEYSTRFNFGLLYDFGLILHFQYTKLMLIDWLWELQHILVS